MNRPLRVALPGAIKETCRLCGAQLEISTQNLKRVCGACGEVNLPIPEAEVPAASAVSKRALATPRRPLPWRELLGLAGLGAAPPTLAAALGVGVSSALSLGELLGHWLPTTVVASVGLTLVSALVLAVRLVKTKWAGYRGAGVLAWVGGWSSAALAVVLLSLGLGLVMAWRDLGRH